MPMQLNELFEQPSEDDRLWRYMDLSKFAALITTQTLWFSNAEVLAKAKEDPQEAALPAGNFSHRNRQIEADVSPDELRRINQTYQMLEHRNRFFLLNRKAFFIHCWHMRPNESVAMWKIYGAPHGIAITSRLSRLTQALSQTSQLIRTGKVQYIDFENESVDQGNAYAAVLTKRNNFAYETEFRLFYHDEKITNYFRPMLSGDDCKARLPD